MRGVDHRSPGIVCGDEIGQRPVGAIQRGVGGGFEAVVGVAEGALLQINVCSLLGNNGLEAQEAAVGLLRSGYAFTLASDAHPGTRDHTAAPRP